MAKLLVISDTHLNPASDETELWYNLGKYCAETQPTFILHLGDVADLNSQAWKIAARGVYSLEEELDNVNTHLAAFEAAIEDYNNHQRVMKKRMYRPVKILTLGNHDVRNGCTGIQDIFEDYGWQVADYLSPVEVYGVQFCHSLHKGLSDLMCTTAQELVENWHSDIVVGHGHHKDFFESYSLYNDKPITGIKCPVFTMKESDWATQTQLKWSRGFTEITKTATGPLSFVWKDLQCLSENS